MLQFLKDVDAEMKRREKARRLQEAAPDLLVVCKTWQRLAENSMAFRLALTSLDDNIGVELLELTQIAIARAEGRES